MPEPEYAAKVRMAEAEVVTLLKSLPTPLRERAEKVPVTYQPCPTRELVKDGIEEDTLGLFVGPEFAGEVENVAPMAAQVFLFIDNLWDQAEGDPEIFKEEVRTTLLHELGHYLGLDEDDLADRGLE
jgi:predicted Zn-dependent protease with MMP-like domain